MVGSESVGNPASIHQLYSFPAWLQLLCAADATSSCLKPPGYMSSTRSKVDALRRNADMTGYDCKEKTVFWKNPTKSLDVMELNASVTMTNREI